MMRSLRGGLRIGFWLLSVAGLGTYFGHSSLSDAYSDPYYYDSADIVAEGGSGRRWFTGSPNDRYACPVCHTPTLRPWVEEGETGEGEGAHENEGLPPRPMALTLEGIELEGAYKPGETYVLKLDVDADVEQTAFVLEVTDAAGQAFGSLSLPDRVQNTVRSDEVFEALLAEDEASQRIIYVLGAPNPGVAEVHWRAPESASEDRAWIFAQAVHSDGSEDPSGDRTASLYLPLHPATSSAEPREYPGLAPEWLHMTYMFSEIWLAPWVGFLGQADRAPNTWHPLAISGEREP